MCRIAKKRKYLCKYGHCEMYVPKSLPFNVKCPVCQMNKMNIKMIEVENVSESI